ncbi:MAG: SAM-dependent methyltransferase [Hyphomonadaceae bacterium]|nr:SAM-dependent methyltransferase [Hyphomonadaceae bacterium]
MIEIAPIGVVHGGRTSPIDDNWGDNRARIELDPARFGPDALAGLDAFSHVDVIFLFHQVKAESVHYGARRPRGRPDWPEVGIFAQRGKDRPNRLGLCTCCLVGIEGLAVLVEGLDAIDGSPVLDIKPTMVGFLPRGAIVEPDWARDIMKDYWS